MSSQTAIRGKIFRDPVHELIRVEAEDSFALNLMDTPAFQRLRRVRQLGVSALTYPGAEHSRFAHSLGVFNFAQRILGILRGRYHRNSTATDLLDQNAKTVKAAALLHDIGHGPFSHMAERAFGMRGRHEKKTVELITGEGSIREILSDHKIDPEYVANLITGASEFRILVDIVSSQLDADRMDYILRDAHSTGVKYGSFDSEWLLSSLCIGTEPNKEAPGAEYDWRLCLDERRGLHSAEQFIIARMHMSLQVYFHHATRGWEAHLLCLFREAAALAEKNELPASTPDLAREFFRTKGKVGPVEFPQLDEATILCAMQQWTFAEKAPRLQQLASSFLTRRKLFKCFELPASDYRVAMQLSGELKKLGREERDWLLDSSDLVSYEDFDSIFRGSKRTPAEVSTTAVLLAEGTLAAAARPVEADSIMLRAMGDNPIEAINRLYCHQDIVVPVKKMLAELGIL
jgi:HD superfamily phosphohydrolase